MRELNETREEEIAAGVQTDGTHWKTVPRWHVTKDILTEYISLVTKAANAAIDKHATDPVEDAARALAPVAPRIAIGEPFARTTGGEEEGFPDLPTAVARFESAGLQLTGLVASAPDDWDRYESLHWRAAVEHGGEDVLATHRGHLKRHLDRRERLGWAIFTGVRSERAPAAG